MHLWVLLSHYNLQRVGLQPGAKGSCVQRWNGLAEGEEGCPFHRLGSDRSGQTASGSLNALSMNAQGIQTWNTASNSLTFFQLLDSVIHCLLFNWKAESVVILLPYIGKHSLLCQPVSQVYVNRILREGRRDCFPVDVAVCVTQSCFVLIFLCRIVSCVRICREQFHLHWTHLWKSICLELVFYAKELSRVIGTSMAAASSLPKTNSGVFRVPETSKTMPLTRASFGVISLGLSLKRGMMFSLLLLAFSKLLFAITFFCSLTFYKYVRMFILEFEGMQFHSVWRPTFTS